MTRPVPPGLRLLAEEMFAIVPPPPNANREIGERFILHAPENGNVAFTGVMRVRLGEDDVEAAVEEVRGRFRALGRESATWWVGPSSQPPGLAQELRRLGLRPLEHPQVESRYEALVLLDEPDEPPSDVVARRVRDPEEYRAALRIYFEVAEPGQDVEAATATFAEHYEQRHVSGENVTYLAWVDGEPVASGSAHFTPDGAALTGGYTLEQHRGRGAYRALVRARWQDAADSGTPGLAVMGGSMSAPALQRLGFQSLGTVELLVDDFGSARAS